MCGKLAAAMTWESKTVGRGSYGKVFMWDARIDDANWIAIEMKLGEAWWDVSDMIAGHLAARPEDAWSALVVSIRPDGGDLMVVPCAIARDWNRTRDMYEYSVEVRQLEQEYFDLPDSQADLEAFERAHDQMMERAAAVTFRALAQPLQRLRALRPFELWRCDYSDADELRPWT
jgi:hypothetical protein